MNKGVKGVEVASCNDQARTLVAVTWAANPRTHRCHAHRQSAGYKIQKIAGDAVTAVALSNVLSDITPEVIYG